MFAKFAYLKKKQYLCTENVNSDLYKRRFIL